MFSPYIIFSVLLLFSVVDSDGNISCTWNQSLSAQYCIIYDHKWSQYRFSKCTDDGFLFVDVFDNNSSIVFHSFDEEVTIKLSSKPTATCYSKNISQCNQRWIAQNAVNLHVVAYLQPDCDEDISNTYNCYESIFIHAANDKLGTISGEYVLLDCYREKFRFTQDSYLLFYDDGWFINDTAGNQSINVAYCFIEMSGSSIVRSNAPCIAFMDDFNDINNIETDYDLTDTETFIIIYVNFVVVFIIILLYYYHKCSLALIETGNDAIPQRDSDDENDNVTTDRTEQISSSKTESNCNKWKWLKCHPKLGIMLMLLAKITLELYDFCTDIILGIEWSTMDVSNSNLSCRYYELQGVAILLMVSSSFGFLAGIYCNVLSWNQVKLTKNAKIWDKDAVKMGYFLLATMLRLFMEDISSIAICLAVLQQYANGIPTKAWYIAYYSSCFTIAISVILLVKVAYSKRFIIIRKHKPMIAIGILFLSVLIFPLLGFQHHFDINAAPIAFVTNIDSADDICITNTLSAFGNSKSETFLQTDVKYQGMNIWIEIECIFYEEEKIHYAHCYVRGKFFSDWYSDGYKTEYFCHLWMFLNVPWTGNCGEFQDLKVFWGYVELEGF